MSLFCPSDLMKIMTNVLLECRFFQSSNNQKKKIELMGIRS